MKENEKIVFLQDDKLTSSFLYDAESRIYEAMVERSEWTSSPLTPDIEAYTYPQNLDSILRWTTSPL
jgi:hypothetical protein